MAEKSSPSDAPSLSSYSVQTHEDAQECLHAQRWSRPCFEYICRAPLCVPMKRIASIGAKIAVPLSRMRVPSSFKMNGEEPTISTVGLHPATWKYTVKKNVAVHCGDAAVETQEREVLDGGDGHCSVGAYMAPLGARTPPATNMSSPTSSGPIFSAACASG